MIKYTLRMSFLTICVVLVSPLVILAHIWFLFGSDSVFCSAGNLVSLVPGLIGSYIRIAYYKGTVKKVSSKCYIGFGSFLTKRDAEIGSNANIGAYCIIGNAKIGNNVLIASRVSLLSGKYQHGDSKVTRSAGETNHYDSITIGKNTWIGEGSIVAADVGENCIISFGAAVNRKIPDNYLAAGNPAKPIKRPTTETA